MKDGVPVVYWMFRSAWTVLHLLLVLSAGVLVLWWGIDDGNARRLLGPVMSGLLDVQSAVAGAIPWPWDA
ncbi:MAG: hypothetical protein IRZ08_06875 [Frankia sp.]|nr:hypothetical protein [Frankia sp.]